MATLPKHRDVLVDVSCVLTVGLIVACFFIFGEPPRRGFFCDDDSIKYPMLPETVSTPLLVVVSFTASLTVIFGVECFRLFEGSSPRDSWPTLAATLFKRLAEVYGIFLLGAGLSEITVNLGKVTIGRLRPYFLDVCKLEPPMCNDVTSDHKYITNYTCTGDSGDINEARLSFPSGHAALSFYTAVYVSIFLQHRLRGRIVRLPRHLLQALLLLVAWFTALSRVHDNRHHATDVLAGIVVGVLWAVLVTTYVINLKIDSLSKTTKDELHSNRTSPNHFHGLNNV